MTENRQRRAAVVMGLSPTGLHVVRSLGRDGVAVTGVADGFQTGSASRFLKQCLVPASAAEKLEKLCGLFPERGAGQPGRPVLIPSSDQDVDFIVKNAQRLAAHFAFQASYADGIALRIMAKDGFYAMCKSFGVAHPELWEARREELGALAAHVPYPVMVKPARIHDIKQQMRGKKGWTIANAEEMRRLADNVPDGAGTLIVQEIVPGPESAITLACAHVAADGSLRHLFTARKLRQYPPGFGSASLVQSAAEPETAEITSHFLRAAGYRGIASSEFKRDPVTGKLKIIEINVRPALWFSVSQASGRPVVLSAYRELAGESPIPEQPQSNGVRWRYGLKDTWSTWFYARNSKFVLPPPDIEAVGPASKNEWPVAAFDDPLPMLAELGGFAEKGLRRALAPLTGRRSAAADDA